MRYRMGMIPMIPRRIFLLAGASLALSAVLVHTASASPADLERTLNAVRSAGFSIPESYLPVAVSAVKGVPVPAQQEPTAGDQNRKANFDFDILIHNMALEPVDEAFCDGKLGVRNPKNEVEYRSCRITRNFLWMIGNAPEQVKGLFPELAELKYCRTAAERKVLLGWLEDAAK